MSKQRKNTRITVDGLIDDGISATLRREADLERTLWLREKWRNVPKFVPPSSLVTTEWNDDKSARKLVADAPRPRKPSRRSALGGGAY